MQVPTKHYLYYTWGDFEEDVLKILRLLRDNIYHTIAPVAFGGLTLGTKLKNIYDVKTRIIFASSYNSTKKGELKVKVGDLTKMISPVLVVDDIADTGTTLDTIASYLQNNNIEFDTLTLFYKKRSIHKPSFYLHKVEDDRWIIFPWE
ncbi:MAG: hypothetical protein DRO67_01890 [Candidatus Asgardarchaeum californiense]|nr:MAG: hypothetical protein DRO67_01890 [Candidatus Asgardarchaeum californiense]